MEEFFKPYRSMYVDMKLPEIATIQQDRYDRAKEEKTALDRALGRMQLNDPGDVHRNRLKKEIEGLIGSRPDFENLQSIITDVTTKVMSDQPLLRALDTWEAREKERETINKLIAEGNQVLDFGDAYKRDADGKLIRDANGKPIRDHVFQKWDTEEKGVYRQHAEQRLPWEVTAQQLMQGIAEDPIKLARLVASGDLDKDTADQFLKHGTEVSREKVTKVANALAEEYMQTSAGRQQFRTLTSLEINPETNELYTPEEAKKTIADYLYGIGSKQEGAKLSYTEDPLAMAKAKAALETPEAAPSRHYNIRLENGSTKAEADAEAALRSGMSVFDGETQFDKTYSKKNKVSLEERQAKAKNFQGLLKSKPNIGEWSASEIKDNAWALTEHVLSDAKISKYKQAGESKEDFAARYVKALKSPMEVQETTLSTGDAAATANSLVLKFINDDKDQKFYLDGMDKPVSWKTALEMVDDIDGIDVTTESSKEDALKQGLRDGTVAIHFQKTGPHAGRYRFDVNGVNVYLRAASQQDNGFELPRIVAKTLARKEVDGTTLFTDEELDAVTRTLFQGTGVKLAAGTKMRVRAKFVGSRFVPVLEVGKNSNWTELPLRDAHGNLLPEGDDSWVGDFAQIAIDDKLYGPGKDPSIFGPLQMYYDARSNTRETTVPKSD